MQRKTRNEIQPQMPFVKHLPIHKRPAGIDPQGQVFYEPNPAQTPYIIYDSQSGRVGGVRGQGRWQEDLHPSA
jgi:hypothetical protein